VRTLCSKFLSPCFLTNFSVTASPPVVRMWLRPSACCSCQSWAAPKLGLSPSYSNRLSGRSPMILRGAVTEGRSHILTTGGEADAIIFWLWLCCDTE